MINKDFIIMTILWTAYLVATDWIFVKFGLMFSSVSFWSYSAVTIARVIIGFWLVEWVYDNTGLNSYKGNGRGRK